MATPTAEKRRRRRAEISAIQEAMEQPQSLMRDFEQDGLTLTFTLAAKDASSFVTLTIPDAYPDEGSFKVYDSKGERNLGRASIKRIVSDLVTEFATANGVAPWPVFPEEAAPVFEDEAAAAPSGPDFFPKGDPSGCKEKLVAVLERYARQPVKGQPPCGWHQLATKDIIVRLPVSFPWLRHQTAKVWGLHFGIPVVLEMQIPEPFFLRSRERPKIRVYQTADTDLHQRNVSAKSFGLQWMIQKRIERTMAWPIREDDGVDPDKWLPTLVDEITDAIRNCNKSCIICNKPLEYVGLKPAVCSDPLCTFSHMQFGLGEDVIAAINSHPEVIDLLINLTFAASQCDINRFNPFPAGVEVTFREEGAPTTTTLTFMKGPDVENDRDASRVTTAITVLPPVNEMARFPESKKLQEHLDRHDRLAFPLVRWIITSCRAHLEPLPAEDQFKVMNTSLQYVFVSTPPEVEAQFNELRRQHGSILAWHGSSFGNWHAILRMGLKNFSGSKFQTHGAAYGAGIYLAADAGTSLGYAQSISGWDKSMMGRSSFQGLALCEIIDYKKDGQKQYSPNPYYVIPEEGHVLTRFLFIYPSGQSAGVAAEELRKQYDKIMAKMSSRD